MSTKKKIALAGFVTIVVAIMISSPARVAAAGTITFVSYDVAAVRIDDDPPKEWGLYREAHGRTHEVLLLEWGKRLLILDAHLKEARELKPDSVTRKKNSITWNGDLSTTTVLPSADWIFRDVGPAQRMHVVLTAEGHEIEMELPKTGR
jgi:hypothetical protein